MNRNRQLAKANWDPSRGNYMKYMRYGKDWRYPHMGFAPLGKRTSAALAKYIECEHEWRRMHRTRRSSVMLRTKDRHATGRAATRWIKDTQRHQICINCGFSRLHPRYQHRPEAFQVVRESPSAASCD